MKTNLLRPLLAREHAEWRHEVDAALNAARRNEAGPWARWNALRYLAGGFPAQAAKERRLVQSVDARLSPAQRAHLWALGELLEILPAYLGHLIGLCHRAGDFALGDRGASRARGPKPIHFVAGRRDGPGWSRRFAGPRRAASGTTGRKRRNERQGNQKEKNGGDPYRERWGASLRRKQRNEVSRRGPPPSRWCGGSRGVAAGPIWLDARSRLEDPAISGP